LQNFVHVKNQKHNTIERHHQVKAFQKYVVTGKTVKGTRFSMVYSNEMHAMSINLWKGSVWGVNENGKRKLIKRVNNY